MSEAQDEEALVTRFPDWDRREHGAYFTPAPLVERVFAAAWGALSPGPVTVVDPACGAGAFLVRAPAGSRVFGGELSPDVAALCQRRVPRAETQVGDSLRGGFEALCARLPANGEELWIGNPPFNGTSSVLEDAATYARLRALLPAALPRGTSLRDDFVFFLLLAAERLKARPGVLAFITPASFLDAFLYAPVRAALLRSLALREVVDLGAGAFADTHVRTCFTVWRSRPADDAPVRFSREGEARTFVPRGPAWSLAPASPAAEALDARWSREGEPLTSLVPVSLPGLKTRFDELLVDDDTERLLSRLRDFARARDLSKFCERHGLAQALLPKLRALKEGPPIEISGERVRPFFRYAGARHRFTVPASARAFCYLDRRLIPRGDHRLRGAYDPHRGAVKLLFNLRERPLSAALLEEEGCVHDHRHARFAPLRVPLRIREEGLDITRAAGDLGPLVANLSPRGRAWAQEVGSERAVYERIVAFINSDPVQKVWAPAYATTRVLPVPLPRGHT